MAQCSRMVRPHDAALRLETLTEERLRPHRAGPAAAGRWPGLPVSTRASGCSGPWTSSLELQALAEEPFGLRVSCLCRFKTMPRLFIATQRSGMFGSAGETGILERAAGREPRPR